MVKGWRRLTWITNDKLEKFRVNGDCLNKSTKW